MSHLLSANHTSSLQSRLADRIRAEPGGPVQRSTGFR